MYNDSIEKMAYICIVDGQDLCVRECMTLLMIPGV